MDFTGDILIFVTNVLELESEYASSRKFLRVGMYLIFLLFLVKSCRHEKLYLVTLRNISLSLCIIFVVQLQATSQNGSLSRFL